MKARGLRTLLIIWAANLISMFGSGLTGFAMGVWVYQRSGSVTQFALTVLSGVVPGLLVTPFAGFFVDRWPRRWVMILSDVGAALSVLTIGLLLLLGRFQVRYFYVALAVGGVFGVFRQLAFSTTLPMLVPKEHLGRVSGLLQMGYPAARIICPVAAGLLLAILPIHSVILIDFFSFFAPILTMLVVRIPTLERSAEGREGRGSFWDGLSAGWAFISRRRGVLVLLLFFIIINFTMGLAHALYQPLLLSFASVKMVGLMSTISGCGLLSGSVVMVLWGGPKRRMRGIFGFGLLYGLGLVTAGLRESVPLIGMAFFVTVFGVPLITGSMQAMWLRKTPPDLQGRVFAVWTMILKASLPLAYLASGPLADRVFRPLLAEGGPLSESVGVFIGVGPGRGIGLMYVTIGIVVMLTTTASYLHPRFRLLEDELPDVTADEAADKTAAAAAPASIEQSYA
ncbi:MAG TPA: MFS transporter [Pyrinomonadaceae bacterium]|jgi:MFS family permease